MVRLDTIMNFEQLKQYLLDILSQEQVIVYSAVKGAVASFAYKSGYMTTPTRAFIELELDLVMDTIMQYLELPQGIDADHLVGLELTPKTGRFPFSYQAIIYNPKNQADRKQSHIKIVNRIIEILQKDYKITEQSLNKYLAENPVNDEDEEEDLDEEQ